MINELDPEEKVRAIRIASKISEHPYLFVHPNDYQPTMSLDKEIKCIICISVKVKPGTVFMSPAELLHEDFDMEPLRAPTPGKPGAILLSSLAFQNSNGD